MYVKRVNRIQRVSQEIQKKVSVILQREIRDPRIGIPTISGVKMSKDLKNAKIFITFLDKENPDEIYCAVKILQQASCFIRYLLAHAVYLRMVPTLLFKYDSSLIEGLKICNLVSKFK